MMSVLRSRKFFVGFGCLMLLVLLCGRISRGDQAKSIDVVQAPKKPTPLYFRIGDGCKKCHSDGDKLNPVICRCTEYPIWNETDKHRDAYRVLKEPRGIAIGKALGIEDFSDRLGKGKACISCHGGFTDPHIPLGPKFDPSQEGVTCCICHGPYEEWHALHGDDNQREKWRVLPRSVKESDYGMTDLWDPKKRAELCSSCHIGNPSQGKVVTHEMYAAGHPPLPSFELATFSNSMRHWEYLKQKSDQVLKWLDKDRATVQFDETQLVAVGSAVDLRDSLNLLHASAEECKTSGSGLNYAHFDCYACHHDLKSDSWRQQRGFSGRPGRPAMKIWPTTLLKLVLEEVGPKGASHDIDTHLEKLSQAFDGQPLGDCEKIAAESKALVTILDKQVLPALSKATYNRETAERLLHRLCTAADNKWPDYESARQVVWGFEVIYREWRPEANAEGPAKKQLDEQLEKLKAILRLKLPAGRKTPIETDLPEALGKLNNYDPIQLKLRDRLHDLATLLTDKQPG